MEIKELMIGDWISYYETSNHDKKIRIESIIEEGVNLSGGEENLNWLDYDKIQPIPLTPEILDLNCIEYNEYCNMWYIQDGVYTIFELDVRDNDFAFGNFCSIKYVHELQRALRCCGLWDLADKFKVE